MDESSHFQGILDDPDDDAPRLAFADSLEVNGQPARAEWIRASCELSRVRYDDERRTQALQRVRDAFTRCRPPWWESLTNIDQVNDRGVFRFVLGGWRSGRGPTPVKRLGKVAWLGQAFEEGWLRRIDLMWEDGTLSKLVAGWKWPASSVPLLVRPAPQIDDAGLREVLALAQLQGLVLESNVLRNPAVKELANYPAIRELTAEFRLVDGETIDAVLGQIVAMPGLRRLHLMGHERLDYGTRPNDADVLRVAAIAGLKRLYLSASPAVSDSTIEGLRGARSSVIVARL